MASFSAIRAQVLDREERRRHYSTHLMGLNAYDRHKKFMNDYVLHYGKSSTEPEQRRIIKTDQDTLRETYRFIRTEEDDMDSSWEQRLAKRYYNKLFKEYCIADMARYKDGKIGMRWRSEKEVISGKGQFVCGNKSCDAKDDLSSYEVNFAYREAGENKQALVKLRVCSGCGEKLNYRRERDREKLKQQEEEDGKRSKSEKKQSKLDRSQRSSKKRRMEDLRQISHDGDDDDDSSAGKESTGRSSSSPSAREESKPARPASCEEESDKYFEGMFP